MSPENAIPEQPEKRYALTHNQALAMVLTGGLITVAAVIIMIIAVVSASRQELPQILQQSKPDTLHSFPAITPLA